MGSRGRMSDRAVAATRIAAGAAAALLLLAGFLGDTIGTSSGAGFGTGQAIMCGLGAVLAAIAILGRTFPAFWGRLALVLANAAVIIAVLELAALGVEKAGTVRVTGPGPGEGDGAMPLQFPATYQPYVGWRSASGSVPGMTVGEDGLRITPGASEDPGAFTVFVTGGSTVWGFGLDDSSTIPARLQQILSDMSGRPVRVVNLGQVSWVSTQCLLEILLRLQAGDRPDLVVMYGGFNDINSMRCYGRAGVPFGVEKVAALVERGEPGGAGTAQPCDLLRSSALYRLLSGGTGEPLHRGFVPEDAAPSEGIPPFGLSEEALEVWAFNRAVLDSLGRCYGFGTAAFWEPVLAVSGKDRTEEETRLLATEDSVLSDALVLAWDMAAGMEGTFYLGGSLDGFEGQAFTDEVHLTADASGSVTGALADSLMAAGLLAELLEESAP